MDLVKLVALDAEDLAILSAHVQDAVFKPAQARWLASEHRFVLPLNRFAWEKTVRERAGGRDASVNERRGAVLNFDRVTGAKVTGLAPRDPGAIGVLLAITFQASGEEEPDGDITLHLAGGGRIRLNVECIEARLGDLGAVWGARKRPDHETA